MITGNQWTKLYIDDPGKAKRILAEYKKQTPDPRTLQPFFCIARGHWQDIVACVICDYFDPGCKNIPDPYKPIIQNLSGLWSSICRLDATTEDNIMAITIKKKKKKVSGTDQTSPDQTTGKGLSNGDCQLIFKGIKDLLQTMIPGLVSEALKPLLDNLQASNKDLQTLKDGVRTIKEQLSGLDTDIQVHSKTKTEKRQVSTTPAKASLQASKQQIVDMFDNGVFHYKGSFLEEIQRKEDGANVYTINPPTPDNAWQYAIVASHGLNGPYLRIIKDNDGDTWVGSTAWYDSDLALAQAVVDDGYEVEFTLEDED